MENSRGKKMRRKQMEYRETKNIKKLRIQWNQTLKMMLKLL